MFLKPSMHGPNWDGMEEGGGGGGRGATGFLFSIAKQAVEFHRYCSTG